MLNPAFTDTTTTGDVDSQSYGGELLEHEPCSRKILERLFRQEKDGLARYLRQHVGPEMAYDLVQEIFLRAATSPQLVCLVNPRAFLYHIARNAIIDHSRRKKCRITTLPLIEAHDTRCSAEQELQLDADDLIASLEYALKELPEKTRLIFRMHRFDEMAYEQIRAELGISIATVEYHMMKALAHIRIALACRL